MILLINVFYVIEVYFTHFFIVTVWFNFYVFRDEDVSDVGGCIFQNVNMNELVNRLEPTSGPPFFFKGARRDRSGGEGRGPGTGSLRLG